MILSVPHTGTRTLMRVLGETQFWHFGQNEGDFEHLDRHIDFPIRDPLATSISWRCYQCDRTDMDEFRRWELAMAHLKGRDVTIHRIEDHPVLEGKSSNDWWWKKALANRDLDALKKLPEVEYLLSWYPTVEDFWRPHYPGGFWWQNTEPQSS